MASIFEVSPRCQELQRKLTAFVEVRQRTLYFSPYVVDRLCTLLTLPTLPLHPFLRMTVCQLKRYMKVKSAKAINAGRYFTVIESSIPRVVIERSKKTNKVTSVCRSSLPSWTSSRPKHAPSDSGICSCTKDTPKVRASATSNTQPFARSLVELPVWLPR